MIDNTASQSSGGAPPEGGARETRYPLRDRSGKVVAVHVREDRGPNDKEVRWKRPDGAWGLNGTKLVDLPLYGVHELHPEAMLAVVTEGEKARDALEEALRDAEYARDAVGVVGTVTGASKEPSPQVLEALRGLEVVLWPDTDPPGIEHMSRLAESLAGIAAKVRMFTWHDAPVVIVDGKRKGQDAADHPAVKSGDEDALGRLVNDLCCAREWEPPEPDDFVGIDSPLIQGGFGENKPLPIKTVEEILEEAGEEVPWVVEHVLARGALTDFSGLAKKGGKTTFWCHAIGAGARGEDHAGFRTESARYLYLTEQGNNFAQPLRESGLTEHPDHVLVVQFKDVSALAWNTLIQKAGLEAKNRGLDVLVVDTFAVFAGLRGSEENDAGPVADRMRVLRLVAQKYGIAVLLIRHAGKDGTPRGSSAFEAEADICVTLSRPEGRHAPSVRKITGIGRYGEWERNIQLTDGRYVSLGTDDKVEFNKAVKLIKAVLPISPEDGMRKQQVLDKRTENDDVSASTLDRALAWLVKQGDVGEKQLMNQRGKPKVYWLAHKPPGGGDDGGFIYSPQTPFVKGENKSGNDGPTKNGLAPEEFAAQAQGEVSRSGSGPAKALATYLEKPSPERLEYLTKAVLRALDRDTSGWERFAGAMQTVVKNHDDVEVF
ncbi:MAG: AAA family ATPase [Actinomycetota bacterium]|nr:AAA family ATPase [Actinomycetota bacterium]